LVITLRLSRYPAGTLGEYIRKWRLEQGLLQVDLARKIGVNEMTIVKLPAASCGASVTKSSGTPPERDTRLRQGFGAVTSRFLPAASCGASARRRVNWETGKTKPDKKKFDKLRTMLGSSMPSDWSPKH
jgi:transcriptional regulator with XRE-family HTH domain